MKRLFNCLTLLLAAALIVCSLCSCGADGKSDISDVSEKYYSDGMLSDNAAAGSDGGSAEITRKVIEYYSYTVETKTFDTLCEKISNAIEENGGYIESLNSSGSEYKYSSLRSAYYKIRIPSDKKGNFSEFLKQNGNVISASITTDDVTDNYIDVESRIKALELEKETLEELLKKTSSVNETITVYDKLTSVIASIESYTKTLKNYDSLIEYTTFNITVTEVEVETTETEVSWFARTFKGLGNNFVTVGNGLLDFASWLIRCIPYWIIIGIVTVGIILIIKGIKKNRRKKKARLQTPDNK